MRFSFFITAILCATFLAKTSHASFVGSLDENGIVIITALEPTATGGFEVLSASGALEMVADSDFPFFIPNRDLGYVFAEGPGIIPVYSGDLFTGLRYTGDPTTGDLRLQYGRGVVAAEFPLIVGGSKCFSSFGPDSGGNNTGGNTGGGSGGNNSGGNTGGNNHWWKQQRNRWKLWRRCGYSA